MRNKINKVLFNTAFPFLGWLPSVNKKTIKADLWAGITGSIIVLPQGVAFAMIAGLPPVYGLYTAMVTPIIAALFGSSYHLVSGPNTALSILVFSALNSYAEPGTTGFIQLALTLTLLAGVFQLALGLARMGAVVNFVSHVVVIGFTAGAALLIASSQLKQVFGIPVPSGATFIEILTSIFGHISLVKWPVFLVSMITLGAALLFRRISKKLPDLLLAMIVGSVAGNLLGGEGSGIKFIGELEGRLPPFSVPDFSPEIIAKLAPNAFAIALLGLIQAIAIGRSIATKTQQQIDANQEFVGHGLSNIVGSFFSSYASSGSFTRSGINYEAGAKTPMAAIFSSLLLVVIIFLFAPFAVYLPIPAMAGIILLVAYNLVDFRQIRTVIRASRRQTIVLAITFFSTLLFDLEFAVYFGVLFSLFFYLRQTSRPNIALLAPDPEDKRRRFKNLERRHLAECPQLRIVRIDGSLFFGAVFNVAAELRSITEESGVYRVLIIANGINFVDVAGAEWLVQESNRLRQAGGGLYISGLKIVAQDAMIRGGYKKMIGEEYFFLSKQEAITYIFERLDRDICLQCTARIFRECKTVPVNEAESMGKG